jgi:hypothetical protein
MTLCWPLLPLPSHLSLYPLRLCFLFLQKNGLLFIVDFLNFGSRTGAGVFILIIMETPPPVVIFILRVIL